MDAPLFPPEPGDLPALPHPAGIPPPSANVMIDLMAAYECFRAEDFAGAVRLWHAASQSGSLQAINALGWSFDTGDGVGGVPMPLEAIACYRLAAAHNNAAAQCNLAVHLLYGLGVPQDTAGGLALLAASTLQGQEVACELSAAYARHGSWGQPHDEEHAEAALALADRYPGVAEYLRSTGVDYERFGASEVAQILEAAAARVAAEGEVPADAADEPGVVE
jgi:hypothetical protein